MRRDGGGGSLRNLHSKKELAQFRKAARVLRDPGTTSSRRSFSIAAANAVSTFDNHHNRLHDGGSRRGGGGGGGGDNGNRVSEPEYQFPSRVESNGGEKKVAACSWRSQRPSSEKSAATAKPAEKRRQQQHGGDGGGDGNDGSSSSAQEESNDDSSSGARNGGFSKSEIRVADRYASTIFKCKGTNLAPSIRRTSIKKKSKRTTHLTNTKSREQILQIRNSKQATEGLPSIPALGFDQSDDTEDYCNSEDLRRISAASALLSRIKRKNCSNSPSKFPKIHQEYDSSYSYTTPSTNSYSRYLNGGDNNQLDFLGSQGFGINPLERTTPKRRGGCYSPSLSDILRRKGSSILCRSKQSSSGSRKRRLVSMAAQGIIPLLSDDELSMNFGELDLEASSRLDGRRWSSSRKSREGLEPVLLDGEEEKDCEEENNIRSLSHKYRPMFFEELVGQNLVVQSLKNSISKGMICPVYLFHGPRGIGKTSAARIFSAALNCLATEVAKPCGICMECSDFISGKNMDLKELDCTSKKGIDRISRLLKNLLFGPSSLAFSQYKVFVIDECHLLPSNTWMAFLKFLERPNARLLFILITTELDNVPRNVLSRCQKYLFGKIKENDIVGRLRKICGDENLDVESAALDLIALNADGSLRDAETMLDQLSLLGKRITTSLVNELVGVVSDEKLLELLELAMSSNTAETVRRARELMESGIDPMVVISQLATLIMDIIAGTYHGVDSRHYDSFFGGRRLTEAELDRLKNTLKLLSEAEKQLRVSSERSTWFTATLLQLGSVPSSDSIQSGSNRRQSFKVTEEDPFRTSLEVLAQNQSLDLRSLINQEDPLLLTNGVDENSKHNQSRYINDDPTTVSHKDVNNLDDIWVQCVERCHSQTLRHLLINHGKLVSIYKVEGHHIAYVAFGDKDIKTRAERFLSSITNSFESVLQHNVEVRIIMFPDGETSMKIGKTFGFPDSLGQKQMMNTTEAISRERKASCSDATDGFSELDSLQELLKLSRRSFDDSKGKLVGSFLSASESSPVPMVQGNAKTSNRKERITSQTIESIIREQRLETAWVQAVEKGTPSSLSRLKPEKNQILPQEEGICTPNQMDLPSQHWEAELENEIKLLKLNDGKAVREGQISKRVDLYPISPSSLHGGSSFIGNLSKDNMVYESGSGARGCSGCFCCWKKEKPHQRAKVKQGTPFLSLKGARLIRFSWFKKCAKTKRSGNKFRR